MIADRFSKIKPNFFKVTTQFFSMLALFLSGCASYEGRILVDEATINRPSTKHKLHLALVVDNESTTNTLLLNKNVYKIYPDIIDGFSKFLSQHIDDVKVTNESNVGSSLCDVAFYPYFSINLDYLQLKMEVNGKLVDCKTGKNLGNLFINEQTELQSAPLEKIGQHSFDFSVSYATNQSISKVLSKTAATTAGRLVVQAKTISAKKTVTTASTTTIHQQNYSSRQKNSSIDTSPPQITIISPKAQRGLAAVEKRNVLKLSGIVTDESGIAEVSVNNIPVNVGNDGYFEKAIPLIVGDNSIVITALDTSGNVAREQLRINHEEVISSHAAIKSGERHALIIGINRYHNLQKLLTPVNDAQEISKILSEQYEYKVKQITDDNATHDNIMKELNSLRNTLKPDDKLIIYYAGHGILDKTTDASYWLPIDAETNDDTKWIDSKRISDQLKRFSSRQIVVIADSCYSGTLSRQVTLDMSGGDSRENYLKKLQEKHSRVLIASGGNEPVSDSGSSGHSIFAATLINALKNPTSRVFTASELLYSKLKEAVSGRSDQTPEYKYIRNSGHESGDFVFEKTR